jgi:hypothetical protein
MVLASWKRIYTPKYIGGWGLKDIFLFSKALVEKNVWSPIQEAGLWAQATKAKKFLKIQLWIRYEILLRKCKMVLKYEKKS